VLYIVVFGIPALLAAGAIWFLAGVRERDEILRRLRKVQAEKRKVFLAALPEGAVRGQRAVRKRKPAFGHRG